MPQGKIPWGYIYLECHAAQLLKVVNYKEEATKNLPAALYRCWDGSYF
jgi:hypothetical protein